MAAALASANRFPEAKKMIDEAVKLAPKDEQPQLSKRQSLYAQNKPYRMESVK